jgi:hypothetical protein
VLANRCYAEHRQRKARSSAERAADQIKTVVRTLHSQPLYPVADLGLASGMRRARDARLALERYRFQRAEVQIERSIESRSSPSGKRSAKADIRFQIGEVISVPENRRMMEAALLNQADKA